MSWFPITLAALILFGFGWFYKNQRQSRQLEYIKRYHFHNSIKNKLLKKHPQLTDEQIHLVFRGLRDYFYICNRAKKKMVAMPSQVVDDAWHEFILFTRAYEKFSKKALGRFLHHTPSEAMASATWAQEGIKRAWRLACAKEKIDPVTPSKLPLLFRIDAMLNISNGFTYALNCRDKNSPGYGQGYCASDIACASGCTGDSGAGDSSQGFFDGLFDSAGGSDCGGGCGGD